MENHVPGNQQLNFYNNPEEEDKENELPPGFRFKPYDEELLEHYLLKLVRDENSPEGLGIPAVDLYYDAPQELTAKYEEHCEKQWYFFTKRNRKYSGGNRPNRRASNGYWKQTNMIKRVFKVQKDKTEVELGRKITLDYYDKSVKTAGKRTNWKMNEYRVNDKLPKLPINYSSAGSSTELDEWCLCKIYISSGRGNKTNNDGATSEEENEQVTSIAQVTRQAEVENEFASVANFLQQNTEHTIAAAAQEYYNEQATNIAQVTRQAGSEFASGANFLQQNTEHTIAAAPQEYYTEQVKSITQVTPQAESEFASGANFLQPEHTIAAQEYYSEQVTNIAQVIRQAESEFASGANFLQQNTEHTIGAQEYYSKQVTSIAQVTLHVESEFASGANFLQQNTEHTIAGAAQEYYSEQVTSIAQVTRQAENEFASGANFLRQNTEHTIAAAPQEYYSEQVGAEADAHFIPQNTTPPSNDQHIIAPLEYYGQNPGGLDTNSFQLSTTPFINDAFSNSSNSFYFENIIDMNWMSNNNGFGLIDHEEIYPIADQSHDNGFVQPIRSLPATGLPMLPCSNFNQSSSSIPGDGSLASLVFGNGQSNSDTGFKYGGFNQFGN